MGLAAARRSAQAGSQQRGCRAGQGKGRWRCAPAAACCLPCWLLCVAGCGCPGIVLCVPLCWRCHRLQVAAGVLPWQLVLHALVHLLVA